MVATGWSFATAIFISFWRALKNNEIIQLNHFCQPHIETFWYFEVSLWSGEKSHAFPGCAKIVLWLHTARAKNPERTQIPNQTHLSTSDSYEYHPDISWTPPRHPPDTPQTSPGNKRCQQMTTDANRDKEPARDTPRHWRVLFEYVWQCQLAFVGVFLFMEVTRGCLGDVWGCLRGVWGVSEGIWVLFLEIGSAQMCFGFSAFAVRSHNIILAQPGKAWLFFTWP